MLSIPPGFVGPFVTDISVRSAYSEGAGPFRIVPAAVAIPKDLDDLVRLMHHALDTGLSLIPRGAGSGIPGGNVGRGVVVDMKQFRAPPAINQAGNASAGAAVTWLQLDHAAAEHGLRLPPNPSSGAFCTLGGMVATNAAGSRTLRYGSIRPWVRGLELVTSDGEIAWLTRMPPADRRRPRGAGWSAPSGGPVGPTLAEDRFECDVRDTITRHASLIEERFPKTRKNSSGYALNEYVRSGSLIDLLIGSEGTLGIVTRVELDLDRRPAATSTVLLALSELDALGAAVQQLAALDPSAIELLDRTLLDLGASRIDLPLAGVAAVLVVEFERDVEAEAEAVAKQAVRLTQPWTRLARSALTPADREQLWAIRHAASPALAASSADRRSLQVIEDGCVPVESLSEYLKGARVAARECGIDVVAFGHAGDGHLHINALVDTSRPDLEERLAELLDRVTTLLVQLGGTPSGEHGDGRLRSQTLERVFGLEIVGMFRQVKEAFDPGGILNQGVILPVKGGSALADLKVGCHAAGLAPEIADRLAAVERAGAWGVPKDELVVANAVAFPERSMAELAS